MVTSKFIEVGAIFIREMYFAKAGDGGPLDAEPHVHTYDHVHVLVRGSVVIGIEGKETRYDAPAYIYMSAGQRHSVTAAVDDTLGLCVHALRKQDRSEEPIDPASIPAGTSASAFADSLTRLP